MVGRGAQPPSIPAWSAKMTDRGLLRRSLSRTETNKIDSGAAAFFASLDVISAVSPTVADSIAHELRDQRANLKLIASENFSSLAVQLAQGNLFTDKYAEGYAGHRFYAGCDNVDTVEAEAADLGRKLFGADHVYVQPHSGADANLVAFLAILATTVETQFRELADEIGATFMVDMAHFAGLVAGKVFTGDYDPVRHAHVVTTTTHKTLRGPRG